jgi:hypothetical protein
MSIETNLRKEPNPLSGILIGGTIAGILDIVYACISQSLRGRSPLWTLQSVASGLLGNDAFTMGAASGILGLICHFVISIGAAATYWIVSRELRVLRERPIVSGLLFGVCVYLFMNFVVIPLSQFPFELKYPVSRLAQGFVSHAFFVGLPIALALRKSGALRPPIVEKLYSS